MTTDPFSGIDTATGEAQATIDAALLPRALRGGTQAMRDKGSLYLPKWPKEHDTEWTARRDSSFLFNGYQQAVDSHSGKVFSHEIVLSEDVPSEIVTWCENLDLGGQHLDVFASHVFSDSLDAGIGFILTDHPVSEAQITKADELQRGLRPYCTYYPAESVLGWRAERVSGNLMLTMVRLLEETVEPDGPWGEQTVKRVRVLEMLPASEFCQFTLYREDKGSGTAAGSVWVVEDQGVMRPMKRIPLRPFYARRHGFMTGRPWMQSLAWKNLEHWQSASDQRAGLHYARAKALVIIGMNGEDFGKAQGKNIGIGHGTVFFMSNPTGDIKYLEYDAGGLDIGERDLVKIEEHMSVLGLEPLLHRPGNPTATAKSIDESRANSRLLEAARAFGDTIEGVFEDMAMWRGLATSGSVKLNEDFGLTIGDGAEGDLLLKSCIAGKLRDVVYLSELKRRGVLSGDVDPEAEVEAMEAEAMQPGPEGETRNRIRAALRAEGKTDEEIDAMIDGMPAGGSNGSGAGATE